MNYLKKEKKEFTSAKDILLSEIFKKQQEKSAKHIHHEFQDYGYRLAVTLGDLGHKSLYMKLAKYEDRAYLNAALSFAKDYTKVANKGKLFMWKLTELRNARKLKQKNEGKKQLEMF
jgi:hypothetical protein